MRVLVTGASGMLGRALVAVLLENGVTVRALARRNSDVAHLPCPPGELVYGNASDEAAIQRAVAGVDAVFHLAAHLSVSAPLGLDENVEPYRRINVAFTESLLGAALAAGVRRFLFVSSNSVYASNAPVPTCEDAPLQPHSVYGRSKLAAEERVRVYQLQGMQTTIVRPAVIYGPGDRYFTPTVLRLARLPLLPLVAGGRTLFDMVYARDVAELLWCAAQSEAAIGRVYNAGPGQPTTLEQLVAAYRTLTRKGPRIVAIKPAWVQRLGQVSRPVVTRLASQKARALSAQNVALLSQDIHLDMSRARLELGYQPRYSLEEGLRETLNYFV